MYLHIKENTALRNIQHIFTKKYPFLKLEFFSSPHPNLKLSLKNQMLNANLAIKQVARKKSSGEVDISENRQVFILEKDFWELFGFAAQVFRRSGNVWIETSLTDNWTLNQQNREGELLSIQEDHRSLEDKINDRLPDME